MMVLVSSVITVSLLVSVTLAEYGDLRISGGGSSGRLEIQDKSGRWGTICRRGFDDNAGDVACSQLGYDESSRVYTDEDFAYTSLPINVCSTDCYGNEDKLIECYLSTSCTSSLCTHNDDIGVSCSDPLSIGAIIGIVIGFITFIIFIFTCLMCCCNPKCPLYHGHYACANHRQQSIFFPTQCRQPRRVVTIMRPATTQPVQLQPMSVATGPPHPGYPHGQVPYGVPPYIQPPMEPPPPYNPAIPHNQQPNAPQLY